MSSARNPAEFDGRLVVAQLDADANPATPIRYGVMGMPTMNLYVHGEVLAQVIGARSKAALLAAFAEHLGAPAA